MVTKGVGFSHVESVKRYVTALHVFDLRTNA